MSSTFFKEDATKKMLMEFISSSSILSMNENCLKFEEEFSAYQKRRYSTLVNSGSSANLVLIQALLNLGYIKQGDKIAFTSLTWATNVMPIIQLGLVPIPVDIELSTLNNSFEEFHKIVEKHDIRAFFITNVLGFSSNISEISNFCTEKGIILLEDNCESLGSVYKGIRLGNYGLASTSSFFVGHHLSAIEGGMISTDDFELSQMLIAVRAHGWDRNLTNSKREELQKLYSVDSFYDKYTFYDLAYNVRPTEITGFLGHIQLPYLDEIVIKRQENFVKFNNVASCNSHFFKLEIHDMNVISNFAYPVICKDLSAFNLYKNVFAQNSVEIRPIIGGSIPEQPFFRKYIKEEYSCPNASLVHRNGFYLPNRPDLQDYEVDKILDLLRNVS